MVVTPDFHSNLSWSLLCCLCTCISGQFEGITTTQVFGCPKFWRQFVHRQGCHYKLGARDFPGLLWTLPLALSKENRSNIEPKETPSCLIPRLLVVFTRQLEILVTTLISVTVQHLNWWRQLTENHKDWGYTQLGEVVRYELNKVIYAYCSYLLPFLNPFWLQPSVPQVLPFPCHKTEKQYQHEHRYGYQQSTSKHF